jgi:EmrB/QacA subfamily drug resistance transporter
MEAAKHSHAAAMGAAEGVRMAARPHRWLLTALALGTALAPLNSTMVAVALPDISDDFGVGVRDLGWVIVGFLIAMAVTQPVAGKLGDLWGRRWLFLGALAGFAGMTVGAALAPNLPTLIVMRVGQALTISTALPNGAALVRQYVPEHRRAMAYGTIGAAAGLGAAIGPPIGGGLIALGGWRALFWFNLPVVALVFCLALRSIPRTEGRRSNGTGFDLRGAAFLSGALACLALLASAIGEGAEWKILGLGAAGLVLAALFAQSQRQAAEPIVDLGLLRRPAFAGATAAIFFNNLAMYTLLLALPLFLQDLQGRSASEVGVVLTAWTLPVALLSPVGGRLADRWGRRRPAMIGGALVTAGIAPLVALDPGWSQAALEGLLIVVGAGMALQQPAVQTSAVESVTEADAGMASGVFSLGRYTGSIIGSSVLAAIIGARADAHLTEDTLFPVSLMAALAAAGSAAATLWLGRRRR